MAEFAGLSIGSVALTGLFNNCVDTFQYIQLGRNFGNDYESCLIKLDVVKLRFLRWGELMTVTDGDDSQNPRAAASTQREEVVQRLLGQILNIFERAKQTSQMFQNIGKPHELIVDTQPQRGDLAALHDHLQNKMRKRCSDRQKQTKLVTKARWALYKKAHFDRLIEDLTELVDALLLMFPDREESQRQICAADVSDIEKVESLAALRAIAQNSDKLLEEVVAKTLKARGGQVWRNVTASGKAEQFMGNHYVSGLRVSERQEHQEWDGISGTDSAKQHMGNVYGGSRFLAE
jgi:Prion-inhibition and propagation